MTVEHSADPGRTTPLRALAPYAFALGLVVAALVARLLMLPLGAGLAFITFYPATAAAFYFLGRRAGLLALGTSATLGYFTFLPPLLSWTPSRVGLLGTFAFVLFSLFVAWMIERMRISLAQAAAARRELANILEGQTEFICRMKADSTALFVNPAYCEAFGCDASKVVGQHLHHPMSDRDRRLLAEACARLSSAEPKACVELQMRLADNRWAWIQVNIRGYFDGTGRLQEIQFVGRETTDRKRLEALLSEKAARTRDLYENAPSGYYSLDADGRFIDVNDLMLEWLGCPRSELLGKLGPMDFFSAEGRAQFKWNYPIFWATGHVGPLEFDLFSRDGSVRRVSVSGTAIYDQAGVFEKSRSVMCDVTEAYAAREKLRALVADQTAILHSEMVGIVKLRNRMALWSNPALAQMFGYQPEELVGMSTSLLYADQAVYEGFGQTAYADLRAGRCHRSQQQMRRKDGTLIWVDISGVMLENTDDESLWTMVDITAMHERLQRTEYAALHDGLTGLANRVLFDDRLEQALLSANRNGHLLAVCYLDLDGFKEVNDRFGHEAGDRLLCEVGRRLAAAVRANDTVARPGGDEFVLLLTLLGSSEESGLIIARAMAALRAPVQFGGGRQVAISASAGLAMADGQDASTLIAQADAAMFQAKRNGKDRIVIHAAAGPEQALPAAGSAAGV